MQTGSSSTSLKAHHCFGPFLSEHLEADGDTVMWPAARTIFTPGLKPHKRGAGYAPAPQHPLHPRQHTPSGHTSPGKHRETTLLRLQLRRQDGRKMPPLQLSAICTNSLFLNSCCCTGLKYINTGYSLKAHHATHTHCVLHFSLKILKSLHTGCFWRSWSLQWCYSLTPADPPDYCSSRKNFCYWATKKKGGREGGRGAVKESDRAANKLPHENFNRWMRPGGDSQLNLQQMMLQIN